VTAPGRPKPLGRAEVLVIEDAMSADARIKTVQLNVLRARLRGINNAYRKLLKEQPK
jgi:hypothetical protein